MIEKYHFGYIKIDGRSYTHDVEIRWNLSENKQLNKQAEVLPWWRKQSHVVDIEDVRRALEQKPDLVIIGTGAGGVARVTKKVEEGAKS